MDQIKKVLVSLNEGHDEVEKLIAVKYVIVGVIPLENASWVFLKRNALAFTRQFKKGTGMQDVPLLDVDTDEHTVNID